MPIVFGVFLVLALAPLPAALPPGLAGVAWADLVSFVLLAFLIASRGSKVSFPRWSAVTVMWAVGLSMTFGVLGGGDTARIVSDVRPFFRTYLVIGVCLVLWDRWGGIDVLRNTLPFAAGLVVYMAVVVAAATAGLGGLFVLRTENAVLYAGDRSVASEAIRVAPQGAIVAVLAVVITAWLLFKRTVLLTRRQRGLTWTTLAAGVFVVLVAYSRSYVVIIGIAAVVIVVVGTGARGRWQRLIGGLAVAGYVAVVVLLTDLAFDGPIRSVLVSWWEAFGGRVVNGLNATTIEQDSSARWRVVESEAAARSIADHIWFGTGFGVPFRGLMPNEIFDGSFGLTYVHSMYLWPLVKMGVVGTAVVAASVVAWGCELGRIALRSRSSIAVPVAGMAAGILAAGIGSPYLFGATGSIVTGLLVAITLVCRAESKSSKDGAAEPSSALLTGSARAVGRVQLG